jgi:hypothetical protein
MLFFHSAGGSGSGSTSTQFYDAGNSGSGTKTIDWSNGLTQAVTLNGTPTFVFTNPVQGQTYRLIVYQDGSGSRTATWPSTWRNSAAMAYVLTTIPYRKDLFVATWDGADYDVQYYANYGNSAAPIGFGPAGLSSCAVWFDASVPTTITKDGSNKVSLWADASLDNEDASQSTGAQQPTWVSGALNSLPIIRFGAAQNMGFGTDQLISTSTPFSIWVVFKLNSFTNTYPLFLDLKSGTTHNFNFGVSSDASYGDFYFGNEGAQFLNLRVASSGLSTTGYHTVLLTYNGLGAATLANYKLYFDYVSKTLTASGPISSTVLNKNVLCGDQTNGYTPIDADIAEIALFQADESTQIGTLQTYSVAKWGV